jgi:hypothetical protein
VQFVVEAMIGVEMGERRLNVRQLLPADAGDFRGPRWTLLVLGVVNVVGTVRSLIHMAAADSGAQSIASMDVHVAGGKNIVFLLAQWGGAQLLEALIIWVVVWRYRGLAPLMMLVVTVEQVLRVVIGQYKPIESDHTPPGASSKVLLPVMLIVTVVALLERGTDGV